MNPRRQVRRSGARPSYARRPAQSPRRRPKLELPVIQVTWIKTAAIGVVVLLVLVGLARLTALEDITISGNKTLDTASLQKLAEQGVRKQWFGRNVVLINSGALGQYMEDTDAGIKQARVSKQLFHGLKVQITERQPTLNWRSGGGTYLLDSDATVIGPTGGSYAKLPTVTDSSNLPVKEGERVAPTSFVQFTSELARLLPAAGFEIADITVPESTSEIYVKTTKGITLKFDTTRSAAEEMADLKKVQAELTKAKKTPKEYIDVRIPHKAYYR